MIISEETGTSLTDLKEMSNDEVMYYYFFIIERKKMEMEEMEKAQNKAKGGSNTTYVDCPAPEGAKSWDEWERNIIRQKESEES